MKLGELISQIERWSNTSITDPLLLDKEVILMVGSEETKLDAVDVDGDVIILQD